MPKPDALNRDFPQTLKESYDPALERLRVDALITDGIDALIINPDGSLNERIFDSNGDSITLGQKDMAHSIPVVFPSDQAITFTPSGTQSMVETGTVDTAYNEVIAVPAATPTTVTSYTATGPTRLKIIEVTGTNIAEYTILVNGTPIHKKRTYFGMLDNSFQFSKGYALIATDILTVSVLHNQTSVGDFSAFILVLKDF